jgi:undecaprenyl-diphosphatase
MLRFIAASDNSLMHRANNWDAPRWIRLWMMGSTRAGDGWLWYLVGLIALVFGGSERFAAIGAAGLAAFLSVALFHRLKRLAGRRRPCAIEPHCWATLLPPDQFSFPSGHTMTAFAITVAMSQFYPPLAFGLMFCAVSIAVSRIILGMHFLSDVVAGATLGAGLGYLATLAFL